MSPYLLSNIDTRQDFPALSAMQYALQIFDVTAFKYLISSRIAFRLPSSSNPLAMARPSPFSNLMQRHSSTLHYQTFPTTPPAASGPPPVEGDQSLYQTLSGVLSDGASSRTCGTNGNGKGHTPMPMKQLIILAVISLAEQTALNSISPYLPEMAGTFPGVDKSSVGLSVGVIASSFALAQFSTNFLWGRLSDKIGRKPVILTGTLLTAACFILFGLCRTLWQAIVVQVIMGLVNGNAGIVSTVLGEITDRSNQSSVFSYLPAVYGIGSITGPLIGGILVHSASTGLFANYPYLLPNVAAAVFLILDLILSIFLLDESLEGAKSLPPLGKRVKSLFVWLWQFTASARPSYIRPSTPDQQGEGDYFSGDASPPAIFPEVSSPPSYKSIITPRITILLITYGIFNLSNASYNSLYPIFVSSEPPTGRGLSPKEIGLSLAFVGAITITFQLLLFGPFQERAGNQWGYRLALLGFTAAFWAMPLVGYYDSSHPSSKFWLWVELGSILFLKTISTIVGLACAMLLITNSSPNDSTLGTLNGLAQTLSAGGRAIGPLVSGGLFTASTAVPQGEFLVWGVFGGIAAVGAVLSILGVKWRGFEMVEGGDGGAGEGGEGETEETRLLRERNS